MPTITQIQTRILGFIAETAQKNGYPPTLREIASKFGIARGSADYHVSMLAKKGFLSRRHGASRGIILMNDPERLPVLGRVSAGAGAIAEEDVDGRIAVDHEFMGKADYLLRVRGDSMSGEGINDGDYVQVLKRDTADESDLVVALTEEHGEAVIKRLRARDGRRFLESANPQYPPIGDTFRIIGKVTGLFRRFS